MNILPNTSRGGGELRVGGNFNTKKCKFWSFLSYIFQFLSPIFNLYPKSANFENFSSKNANLDKFSQKMKFWTIFHFQKWKIWGNFFTFFLLAMEKTDYCGRISTYAVSRRLLIISATSSASLIESRESPRQCHYIIYVSEIKPEI